MSLLEIAKVLNEMNSKIDIVVDEVVKEKEAVNDLEGIDPYYKGSDIVKQVQNIYESRIESLMLFLKHQNHTIVEAICIYRILNNCGVIKGKEKVKEIWDRL